MASRVALTSTSSLTSFTKAVAWSRMELIKDWKRSPLSRSFHKPGISISNLLLSAEKEFLPALARIVIAVWLLPILYPGSASDTGDVFDQFFRYVEVKNRVIEPHLPGEN